MEFGKLNLIVGDTGTGKTRLLNTIFDGASVAIANLKCAASPGSPFQVHFGVVASGDEDVVDTQRRTTLHQLTGVSAVAWEGAGGARATAFSNVPFVEIRGVTDTADRNAASDFATNLQIAMTNVATLVTSFIGNCSRLGD